LKRSISLETYGIRDALATIVCLVFLIFSLHNHLHAQNPDEATHKTVLLIHSYNKGLSWTDNLNSAITRTFENQDQFVVDTRVEYMDTKRFEDSIHIGNFLSFLQYKYRNTPIDLIVVTDNPAYTHLVKHRDIFGKDRPMVFVGLNYMDTIAPGITGVVEDVDIHSNLSLIQALHPRITRLYIAVDQSITGRIVYNQTVHCIEHSYPDLVHEYITDYTYEEFKDKIASLEEGSVLLLLVFNFDKSGMPISYDHILHDIKPLSNVPIYGVWDFYLNEGIVGGVITSARLHGEAAADIALRVLAGEKPSNIAIEPGPRAYIFDKNILDEFGIPLRSLPKGATIINSRANLVQENKDIFGLIGIIVLLLVLLVIILVAMVRRGKKIIQQERMYLQEIEEKSQKIEEALTRAESATRLQKAFLNNLSHEIRTPMNGIMGFSTLLSSLVPEGGKGKDYLRFIQLNSKHLLNIIESVVEMSKIETQLVMTKHDEVKVNDLIRKVHESFQESIPAGRKIQFQYHLPLEDSRSVIQTDEGKLHQVMSNLVSNAFKFTREGSIDVGYIPEGNACYFYVRDTGIGISSEYHQSIFDHFNQVEQGFSREYGGTGLGLAIARAYVELLDGEIGLESTPGKGSLFYFRIPVNPGHE
jgi:signal transduction histidine kinase